MNTLKLAWNKLIRSLDFTTNQVMYAQEGEDHILRNHFQDKKNGFFVDVGAYHPKHLSNTAYLYQQGWRGINIEPMKQRYTLFVNQRKRDINLNNAVGLETGFKDFCNTDNASSHLKTKEENQPTEKVRVERLDTLLNNFLPRGQKIDLLSVDTEGNDYNVLLSNDWSKYKPNVILVETAWNKKEIHTLLTSKGYEKKYNTCLNSIYVLEE